MYDNRNLTIGVLSITGVVLLVGVILTTVGGQGQALAIGQTDRGGDYIVVTGQFTQSIELVYVVDAATKRLNTYSYDKTRRHFVLWESLDLDRILRSGAP